jgi:hypothetical protein
MTALLLLLTLAADDPARPQFSLDGTWQFRLDPQGDGEAGKWFETAAAFPHQIQVPGNWQAHGFGEPSGIARHDYQGKAWYRRSFTVPADWQQRRIWLRLEGVCNWGMVYVDGSKVGRVESFITPYEFDITGQVSPGREHRLDVMVDSKTPPDALYIGMMQFLVPVGGITSRVLLEARPELRLDRVALRAEVGLKSVLPGRSRRASNDRSDPFSLCARAGGARAITSDRLNSPRRIAFTGACGAVPAARFIRQSFPACRTALHQ